MENIKGLGIKGISNASSLKDISGFGISDEIKKDAASRLKGVNPGMDMAGYFGIAQGALDLFNTGVGNLTIPDYARSDYDQYGTIESLSANAGNTSSLDIEGNNIASGAISGMMTGASAGMALGPIGAGVGAAVGGLTNILTGVFGNNKKKKEEERRYKDTFARINSQDVNIQNKIMKNQIWNDANYFESGGSTVDFDNEGLPEFLRSMKDKFTGFFNRESKQEVSTKESSNESPITGISQEEYNKIIPFIQKAENHAPGSNPIKVGREKGYTTTHGLKRVQNKDGSWRLAGKNDKVGKEDASRMMHSYINEEIMTPLLEMYPGFPGFDSNVKAALIDGIYNVGITKFKNNSPKMQKLLKGYDPSTADDKYVESILKQADWGGKGMGGAKKRALARQKGIMNWEGSNIYEKGGMLKHHTNGIDFRTGFDVISSGGEHSENPLGGIPISTDEEGVPNLVEEGEVIFNGYVFSNKLKADKELLEGLNLDEAYGNKTFADIAEKIYEEPKEREFDPISKVSLADGLQKLLLAQEITKMMQNDKELSELQSQGNVFASGGDTNVDEEDKDKNSALLAQIMGVENAGGDPSINNSYGFFGNYQMGAEALVEVGMLTDKARKEIKEQSSNKKKNAIAAKKSSWKVGGNYDKFYGVSGGTPSKEFQQELANKYVDVVDKQLKSVLGKDYDKVVETFGKENLITATWLGGIGNTKKFLETGKTGLNDSENTEFERRMYNGIKKEEAPDPTLQPEQLNFAQNVETPQPESSPVTRSRGDYDYSGSTKEERMEDAMKMATKKERNLGLDAMLFAPAVGNAVGYAQSLFEKPEVVQYDRVSPERINDRMEYTPMNDDYLSTKIANQYEGSRRGIMEVSGGNRGLAQYGILQGDKNASDAMYEGYYQTQRENEVRKERAKAFNSQIAQFNSQMDLNAQQVNANISMQENNMNAQNRGAARNYRDVMRNAFLDNISGISKQLRWEDMAPTIYGYDSQGNKVKRKKQG